MRSLLLSFATVFFIILSSLPVQAGDILTSTVVQSTQDNGETAQVISRVNLLNDTGGDIYNVTGIISCHDEVVDLENTSLYFGDLKNSQNISSDSTFNLTANKKVALSLNISLEIELSYDDGTGQTLSSKSFLMVGLE